MNIFEPKLAYSPNRDELFDADKRNDPLNLSVWYEALKTDVWYNPQTEKSEVV